MLTLYYGSVSGNSSRSAFALYETNVPFTATHLDYPKGDTKSPEYRALNPMGKIPALVDGAFKLWESNAINGYVAAKHPESRLLPESLEGRASLQRWLFFQAAHVSPAAFPILRSTSRRMQEFWRLPADEAATAAARKELARYLPVLEQALADREWLEGDFSLADIAYAPHLWLLAEGGFDFSGTPRLQAWLDRLLARPAWAKARALVFGD